AQMGLVKAYASTGQTQAAIDLCRTLQRNPNPQIQSWAVQSLKKLAPNLSVDVPPGDVPPDETGFIPLNQPDETGFTPLTTVPPNREVIRANLPQRPIQPSSDQAPPNLEQEDLATSLSQEPETAIDPLRQRPASIEPDIRAGDFSRSGSVTTPDLPHLAAAHLTQPAALPGTGATEANDSGFWQMRQAGRASKWTSLGRVDASPLWALQVGTVVALIGLIHLLLQGIQFIVNRCLLFLNWIRLLPSLWWNEIPIWLIAIGIGGFLAVSPWLLHQILSRVYLLKPLSAAELEAYSPESLRLLRRVCNQRRQPLPRLETLPTAIPLLFSYGYLPHQAHLVISQGLLAQLADDEIAALCAAELGHIAYRDFGVLSGITLIAQIPYLLYWQIATWGDRQHDRVLQSIAVFFSCISYGVYRLCRFAGVWLSRVRLYYSDRAASDLTGNPNGLTRALLKLSIETADIIQQQGYTNPLLESFDLMAPVGYHQALTLGSILGSIPGGIPGTQAQSAQPATLMTWDYRHPYRSGLAFAQSHPPLGDRLNLLYRYARHWHLPFELDWGVKGDDRPINRAERSISIPPRKLLLQTAPITGALVGLALALLLSLLGWIDDRANWILFDWLWFDRDAIFQGCVLLGFGIGMLLKINPAFPDIRRSTVQANPSLPDLLTSPTAMPIDSLPIRIQGTLLGRRGFTNRFYQDLLLETATGLIRLEYTSRLGFLGNLLSQSRRPSDLLKPNGSQSSDAVTVTGWFRRGATPWLEVETIQPQRGTFLKNGHPVWATIVAIGSILLGIYAILRGGL
ncbi:MAG TPA: M48 family metalloprotease, partial [Allocoleopsis sp.]